MGYRHRIQSDFSEDLDLGDGLQVRVRPIQPGDKDHFVQGFEALSADSRQRRCLMAKSALTEQDLKFLTEFDGHQHFALGCVLLDDLGHDVEGLAGARFVRFADDSTVAEMAITVVDRWQHRGIGRLLLERLCDAAAERGVERFRCYVLSHNSEMRRLIEHVAPEYQYQADGSLLAIEFPVSNPSERAQGTGPASSADSVFDTWCLDPCEITRLAAAGFLVTPATFACIAPALWWRGATAGLRSGDPDADTPTT